MSDSKRLSHAEMLQLKRWNTPTIYNGWEQLTQCDTAAECFNRDPVTDYMPHMGPMVGTAVTLTFEPSNPEHPKRNPNAWREYLEYVASVQGPKIVVVQDLDKPRCAGAFWGEVSSNMHRALGCVGTIIDGAIRDLDEMRDAGFKALARQLAVGHGYACPVAWDTPVEVFGLAVSPGQLIHADKHGFLVIPDEDQEHLLEAAQFMDDNECETLIPAARDCSGKSSGQLLQDHDEALKRFRENVEGKFGRKGEW